MKFLKTFNESMYDAKSGGLINTGDFDYGHAFNPPTCQVGWHWDEKLCKCVPDDVPTSGNDKLKFAKASPVAPPTPPNWVKNPTVWSSDELVRLLEKYLSVFASIYAKCFSERYAVPNAVVEVKGRLETLLRELKTKDPLRIEDAVRVFFDNVSPKLSERNVSSWLQSSDGRKWGEAITRFEQLCSYILD